MRFQSGTNDLLFSRVDFSIGSIPESIGQCTDLKEIRLGRNKLTGELRTGTNGLFTSRNIDFVTGKIPEWFGDLKEVQTIDLSYNKFEGLLRRGTMDFLLSLQSLLQQGKSRNLSGNAPS